MFRIRKWGIFGAMASVFTSRSFHQRISLGFQRCQLLNVAARHSMSAETPGFCFGGTDPRPSSLAQGSHT